MVIAIIAILAAILFPVFARARENARRSSCQSNLKQIALGVIQYTQDYDEIYPAALMGVSDADNTDEGTGWTQAIEPYTKSYQILQCPSEPNSGRTDPYSCGQFRTNRQHTDYWINGALAGYRPHQSSGGGIHKSASLSKVQFVANTFMLGDGTGSNAGNGCATSSAGGQAGQPFYSIYEGTNASPAWDRHGNIANLLSVFGANNKPSVERHFEGFNVAFADGHVKWLQKDKMPAWSVTPSGDNYSWQTD